MVTTFHREVWFIIHSFIVKSEAIFCVKHDISWLAASEWIREEPWMMEDCSRFQSFIRINLKKFWDQILGKICNVIPLRAICLTIVIMREISWFHKSCKEFFLNQTVKEELSKHKRKVLKSPFMLEEFLTIQIPDKSWYRMMPRAKQSALQVYPLPVTNIFTSGAINKGVPILVLSIFVSVQIFETPKSLWEASNVFLI